MVTRNPDAPSLRSIAADSSLPAGPSTQSAASERQTETKAGTSPVKATADPARSIADWFSTLAPVVDKSAVPEEISVWDFFMSDDDTSTEARRLHLDTAAVEAERFLTQRVQPSSEMELAQGDEEEEEAEARREAESEQDFALLTNNAFMHYYSSQYVEEMRSLGRFCTTLIDKYVVVQEEAPGSMHLSLSTSLNLSLECGGKKHRSEIEDLVLLVHTAFSAHSAENSLFLLPVHVYMLKARCPALYELCVRSGVNHLGVTACLQGSDGEIRSEISLPATDISDSANLKASSTLSTGVPLPVLFLLPLLVDYLYTGNKAFDLTTVRFYCLQQFLQKNFAESSTPAALFSSLIPHVGDILRAEIYEYLALNGEGTSGFVGEEDDQETYCATRPFFVLRGKAEVELLVKICVDDHCWRQSSALSGAIVGVLQQLIELARVVELPAVRDIACSLLEQSMCPTNAVVVFDTAVKHDCAALRSACLQYISSHNDVLKAQIDAYQAPTEGESDTKVLGKRSTPAKGNFLATNPLFDALQALSTERTVEVVSRSEFRARKLHVANRSKAAARRPRGVPLSSPFGLGELSPARSRNSEDNLLWLMEESPFIPGNEAIPASICLSRYISTTASRMFDHSMIFLGGQNLDRLHSLSNRILTYNYVKNEYKYVTCGGTYVPKCGYMISAGPLQKHNPTHLLAMGGKLKKMEISVKHTTLPQHLHTLSSSLGEVLGSEADEKNSEPGHAGRGINVTASGPTSLVHNRLIDVWNLNADREELSPPTAAATAAAMQNTLDSLRSASEEEGCAQSIALARDMSKSMGVIFELDYRTLTWRSPCVKYTTSTSLSSYMMRNSSQALQHEAEMELLRSALNQRIGQSMSCLYHEDVQYRCQQCLFSTHPSVICNCHPSSAKQRAVGTTWMVQFAGFCNKTEMIMSDLHVLAAEPKPSAASSDPRDVEYEYTWTKTVPSGLAPQGRFSHASAVVPYVPNSTASVSSPEHLLHAYTRVLIFGGVGYNDDMMGSVVSLRVNHSCPADNSHRRSANSHEYSHYTHWEDVLEDGPSPSTRQGHTMVHLPDTNMIVLFGGSKTTGPGAQRNSCCGDVWVMRLMGAELIQESSGFTELHISWSNLDLEGIPSSLRSRHTAFAVPKQASHTYSASLEHLQGVMFVFGGIDEGKLQQRQSRGDEGKIDFDEEQKDSVMHTMHISTQVVPVRRRLSLLSTTVDNTLVTKGAWLSAVSPYSRATAPHTCLLGRFLYFVSEISVPMPACSLTRDMLLLLDPIFSTALTNSALASQAMDMSDYTEESSEEEMRAGDQAERLQRMARDFFAHRGGAPPSSAKVEDSSPLAPRLQIDVIDSNDQVTNLAVYYSLLCRRCDWFNILLTSEMKGAGDNQITELFGTDPAAFRLLLMFIYADTLMICSMQDIVAVLELANQYDLTLLAKKCEGVLVRLITLDNLCELMDYSDTLNLDTLRTACTAVFLRDVIGVNQDPVLLREFFPDMDITDDESSAKPTQSSSAPAADSHRALTVASDATLRAELVSGFAQLSPELRADVWLRATQSVQVFASSECTSPLIATDVSSAGSSRLRAETG